MKKKEKNNMKKGAVTFLDVLGWKGIWQTRDDAIDALSSLNKELKKYARGADTEVKSISDTIVISTSEKDPLSSLEHHGRLCAYAIVSSINKEIPLRGATTYGSYSIHENILIGSAIDEAASWHEKASWIGVMMTPSAFLEINSKNLEYWTEHSPPLKTGMKWETYCVDWTKYWSKDKNKEDKLMELKNSFKTMGVFLPGIAEKYIKSIEFFEKVQKVETKK